MSTVRTNKTNGTAFEKKFEGWETDLDPESLSLISVLNFRRGKDDFSFDKHTEHLTISKFLSYVTTNTADERWRISTSVLNKTLRAMTWLRIGLGMGYYIRWASSKSVWGWAIMSKQPPKWPEPEYIFQLLFLLNSYISLKDQAQTENVKAFWLEVDLEISQKLSNAILEKKKTELKQKDMDIKLTRACPLVGDVDGEKDENDGYHTEGNEKERSSFSVEKSTGSRQAHNNSKRKLGNQSDYTDYEGLALLFDESNEEALMESIDEKTLAEEDKLPLMREKGRSQYMREDVVEAFRKYQSRIPKTRQAYTLYGCKEFTEDDLQQLSQDFADHIKWKPDSVTKNVGDYFDSNCEKVDNDQELRKFDRHVQFMKANMNSFQQMLPEEQLKMTSSFPLFHGAFNSSRIKDVWGETQALSTNDARNEKANPFKKARMGRKVDMKATLVMTSNKFEVIYGEVAGGLGPLGIPMACRKKRFLDKFTAGSKSVGLELNFYAMDWSGSGIYRFGLIDRCRIPADEDDCFMLEDAYCILKSLENKSLETETTVKQLFSENTKGKRRRIAPETEAELNKNRTPLVEELEQKNKELEARLAVVEQSSVVVDGQPQNDSRSEDAKASKEVIPEIVTVVIVPNSQVVRLEHYKPNSYIEETGLDPLIKFKTSKFPQSENADNYILKDSSLETQGRVSQINVLSILPK
ncbi:9934_t:CDS:10 [Ambispora gerdemannii]|uniref:9934_t:CDS:1 n=1 Tax=Ambispora gerdemannii TaxID=144530 RepID=A0A9N9GNE2_9GLOM|nr:9934_t:CDS:10 [Ambispora gerdemannii]